MLPKSAGIKIATTNQLRAKQLTNDGGLLESQATAAESTVIAARKAGGLPPVTKA